MTRRIGFGDDERNSAVVWRKGEGRDHGAGPRRADRGASEAGDLGGGDFGRAAFRVVALGLLAFFSIRGFGGLETAWWVVSGVLQGALPLSLLVTPLLIPLGAAALVLLLTRRERARGEQASVRGTSPRHGAVRGGPSAGAAMRGAAARPNSSVRESSSRGTPVRPAAAAGLGRSVAAGFLGLWLLGWTAGIVFAVVAFLDSLAGGGSTGGDFDGVGPEAGFGAVWLIFAVLAWVVAARQLLKLLAGEPAPGGGFARAGRDEIRQAAGAARPPQTGVSRRRGPR